MTATPETGTPPEPSAEDVKLSGTAVTEWGVRYEGEEARTIPYGTSRSSEQMARLDARTDAAKVVSRTVTYGPWEEA